MGQISPNGFQSFQCYMIWLCIYLNKIFWLDLPWLVKGYWLLTKIQPWNWHNKHSKSSTSQSYHCCFFLHKQLTIIISNYVELLPYEKSRHYAKYHCRFSLDMVIAIKCHSKMAPKTICGKNIVPCIGRHAIIQTDYTINSSSPSAAYMRHWQ